MRPPVQPDTGRVSTHSRLKAAGGGRAGSGICHYGFNTQPPEGGWDISEFFSGFTHVSTHSRLKAAGLIWARWLLRVSVSTHSRLKAAGVPTATTIISHMSFNTQPPEGGWNSLLSNRNCFTVSTHSRLKAAGASLKSLAPSGFAALISLSSQEKREREYNTALSVTPAFAIS